MLMFRHLAPTSHPSRGMKGLTLRRSPATIAALIAVSLALAGAATSTADLPSHLAIHAAVLPPTNLTRPLSNGESAIKGMNPADEQALLEALRSAGLGERILRVAVAKPGLTPVALVKVQAGDAQSRVFSLAEVERDAMTSLAVAFGLPNQIKHVDFWSVVPEVVEDGTEWHRPVFSVAAERQLYMRLVEGSARPDRVVLGHLSAVRYDPVFTKNATDWATAQTNMPRTAYLVHRLADEWRGLVTEGAETTQALGVTDDKVRVLLGGTRNGPNVALTIDDGPHPLITPLFLDVLRREGVKATFFVVGEKAEQFPGLIREIAREGHELANHTYSHRRFSSLSPEEVYAELRGCSKIVGALTGRRMQFVRPPGGDYTRDSLRISERLGLVTALWTHNTGDWAKPEPTAIAYHATHGLGSGDIILMHQGDMRSVLALPMIIQRVRARGLEPVPLSYVAGNSAIKSMSPAEAVSWRARLSLTE